MTNVIEGMVANVGAGDMQGPTQWQLRYSGSGSPKDGMVVAGGKLALKSGASEVLDINGQTAPGMYIFAITQRPGTPSDALAYSESCTLRRIVGTPTPTPEQE